ncbi:hypothetical protein DPEC_G00181180 [Dallia pectoralis]|uniref:Uncharacterized protein n=1 Tax=Dallia pectoralis TaxID=75939 RepID=A0ACC2GA77_DALPE|nr:hypothetical protein DPEC_G00181180 [Dallia pectoralis]
MDVCFLIGLVFASLIHRCKAQDLSTSTAPPVVATAQGPELLPGMAVHEDVAPDVEAPGLEEVEKAVQEVVGAEEPVVEEVLKELLVRAVEAALGEAKGNVRAEGEKAKAGGEEQLGGEEEQKVVVEEEGGLEQHEEVSDMVEGVKDEDKRDRTEAWAVEEQNGGEGVEGEKTTEHEEEVEGAEEVADQIVEAPVAPVTVGAVVEETVSEEEEVGGVEEEGKVTGKEGPAMTEKEGVRKETIEAKGEDEVGWEVEEDDYEEINTTQSVVGEPAVEEDRKEEDWKEKVIVGEKMEEGVGDSFERGVEEATAEELGNEKEVGGVKAGDQEDERGEKVETAGQLGDGEERRGEKGEVFVEETPDTRLTEGQGESPQLASPINPHRPGQETVSNTMGGTEVLEDLESNDVNEIGTTKENLPNLDLGKATPILDNYLEDTAEKAEHGDSNELVEVSKEPEGLETWKIGVISAAVFLFLETIVIIVYVLKCRNHTSSGPSPARVCEQGGVTECRQHSIPATDGVCQLISSVDPSELDQEVPGDIQLNPSRDEPTNGDPSHGVRTSVL